MDFVTESFRKDETAITPKSEDKYVAKVFNWSEFHSSEVTSYKIHTLVERCKTFVQKKPSANMPNLCWQIIPTSKKDKKKGWKMDIISNGI